MMGYEIIQVVTRLGGYEYIGIIGQFSKQYGLQVTDVSPQMFYGDVHEWIKESGYYDR